MRLRFAKGMDAPRTFDPPAAAGVAPSDDERTIAGEEADRVEAPEEAGGEAEAAGESTPLPVAASSSLPFRL